MLGWGQDLGEEFAKKRAGLKGFHQEFEVTERTEFRHVEPFAHVYSESVDMAGRLWRERSLSGAMHLVRLFDGQRVMEFEEGSNEYSVLKDGAVATPQMPNPYGWRELDWSKATVAGRTACEIPDVKHICAWVNIPVKMQINFVNERYYPWNPLPIVTIIGGSSRALVDEDTGLILELRVVEAEESRTLTSGSGESIQLDTTFRLKAMSFGMPSSASIFKLPPNHDKEVGMLTEWTADRMKRDWAGRRAPDLALTDLEGKMVSLANLQGKVVLLDYWATWCETCQEDTKTINRATAEYAGELVVMGVAMDEDRETVKAYLRKHPHRFATALSAENDLPREYRFRRARTFVAIGKDGRVAAAWRGGVTYPALLKELKKGGLAAAEQ